MLANRPETTALPRPTWLQIDLGAVAHNVARLRAIAGAPLLAVVKADAYGHGAGPVARAALRAGARALAVATLGEAATLRHAGIAAPVLLLGYLPPWQAHEAVVLDVITTVFDLTGAQALSQAAVEYGRDVRVHVKVDTGLARIGLMPDEVGPFIHRIAGLPRLRVDGLYTHFATADAADETFARLQLARFDAVIAGLETAGCRPPWVHAANSAALLRFPAARFDMVRAGIALYGIDPAPETPLPTDFRPALSFHTEVAQVKTVPRGAPLSYGCTFVTSRPSRIATIPVGYADGLRRSPAWRAVLVRGRRAPIVGRICMDLALVDVTDIDGVRQGDPVVLIGHQAGQRITALDVAEWLDTIPYEVIAAFLPRVPRLFTE